MRIVISLTPGSTAVFKGDVALNVLIEIKTKLEDAGEHRFPIVEYTQEEEEGGASQS